MGPSPPTLSSSGRLQEIPGIGKSTAAKIAQALAAGKVDLHEQLKEQVPPGLPELLSVGGLGPKTIAKLWKQAGIESLADL
ncbi:MAG: hypothetical protein J7M21_05030, partial [Planctomycetes bacterium]|nr:hypothetical protein [Planctomycetota bacterium]